MLNHQSIGPTTAGNFLVIYQTPGCTVPTVARICTTQSQADIEAMRLNMAQIDRERAIRQDRAVRGLGGAYPDLEKKNGR